MPPCSLSPRNLHEPRCKNVGIHATAHRKRADYPMDDLSTDSDSSRQGASSRTKHHVIWWRTEGAIHGQSCDLLGVVHWACHVSKCDVISVTGQTGWHAVTCALSWHGWLVICTITTVCTVISRMNQAPQLFWQKYYISRVLHATHVHTTIAACTHAC